MKIGDLVSLTCLVTGQRQGIIVDLDREGNPFVYVGTQSRLDRDDGTLWTPKQEVKILNEQK